MRLLKIPVPTPPKRKSVAKNAMDKKTIKFLQEHAVNAKTPESKLEVLNKKYNTMKKWLKATKDSSLKKEADCVRSDTSDEVSLTIPYQLLSCAIGKYFNPTTIHIMKYHHTYSRIPNFIF